MSEKLTLLDPRPGPTSEWIVHPWPTSPSFYDREGRLIARLLNLELLLKIETTRSDLADLQKINNFVIDYGDSGSFTVTDFQSLSLESLNLLDCFQTRAKILGNRSPESLSALSHLGNYWHTNARYQWAADIHRIVLKERIAQEKMLDSAFIDALHALSMHSRLNLADSLHEIGEYEEELEQMRIVLDFKNSLPGGNRRQDACIAWSRVAMLLELTGRYQNAVEFYWEEMKFRSQISRPGLFWYSLSMDESDAMIRVLRRTGDLGKAYPLCIRVSEYKLEHLGNRHTETLEAMEAFALSVKDFPSRERPSDVSLSAAELIYRFVLNEKSERHGPSHSDVLAAKFELDSILACRKMFVEPSKVSMPFSLCPWISLTEAKVTIHKPSISFFLAAGADPDQAFLDGDPPLILATYLGKIDIVEHLLEAGANVNMPGKDGITALSVAIMGDAKKNNLEIVRLLVSHGANKVQYSERGATPVNLAAHFNRTEALQALLDGGEISSALDPRDGLKPIHRAVQQGNVQCVKLLMSQIRKDTLGMDHKAFETALESTLSQSPLFVACKHGHKIILAYLIDEEGLDVNKTDAYGLLPLHQAIMGGHESVIELMLEKSPKSLHFVSEGGRNLLHHAARAGQVSILQKFLDLGLDIGSTDERGDTVLCYAASGASLSCVKHVLQKLSEVERNKFGFWPPLHWACRNGDVHIIRLLFDYNLRSHLIESKDPNQKWTPWDIAVYYKNFNLLSEKNNFTEELREFLLINPESRETQSLIQEKHEDQTPEYICDLCDHLCYTKGYECKSCLHFAYCLMCVQTVEKTHSRHQWRIIERD